MAKGFEKDTVLRIVNDVGRQEYIKIGDIVISAGACRLYKDRTALRKYSAVFNSDRFIIIGSLDSLTKLQKLIYNIE